MRRKFLSVVLCVCMMLTMAPFAFAEGDGDEATPTSTPIGTGDAASSASATVTWTENKNGNLTITDTEEGAVIDGNGKTYTDGTITVSAANVTIKNLTFGDKAALIVNTTGKFTLTGCTFTPNTVYTAKTTTAPALGIRTAVKLNVGEAVVTNNTFNGVTNGYYNAIEFGIGTAQNDLNEATISGNTFNSAIKNNYFNFYNMTADAVIDITGNHFLLAKKGSNAIRISNFRNVSGVTFNVNNNEYTYANDSDESQYEGFILLEDYSPKGDTVQDFSGITININNLTSPSNAKQLFYVYDDQDRIIARNQPIVKGDSSISKFCSARIGDTYYASLVNAVADASTTNPDTIKLLKDTTERLILNGGKEITLDLGGNTLSYTEQTVRVNHGKLTVNGPGAIKEINPNLGAILIKGSTNQEDTNYSVVNVNGDVTLSGWAPLFIDQNSEKAYGVTVNLDGATLNGKRDSSGDLGSGIYVNGSIKDTTNAPAINLKSTTVNSEGQGMYLAGYTTTTVDKDSSVIGSQTGIEIRAGKLNVSGATIIGNGDFSCTPNGNGSTTNGVGIAIAQHTTKLPTEVTISGGTISGKYAVYESNPQNNDATSIGQVKLSITDGNFNGSTAAVYSHDVKSFISGGLFTSDPSDYCVANKTGVASNDSTYPYTVGEKNTESKPATVDSATVPAKTTSNNDTVKEVASSISGATVENNNATEAATKDIANENKITADTNISTDSQEKKVSAALNEKVSDANKTTDANPVAIVYQTYVDVTVTDAKKSDTSGTTALSELSVELTPMYRVVATTKNVAESTTTEIKLAGNGVTDANAIQIGEPQKLNVPDQEYIIKLALPSNLDTAGGKLSIKHTKENGSIEYYTGTVSTEGKAPNTKTYVTFTTNGFSPFVIYAASANVASIGEGENQKVYPTLQAAIDAVQNNETITLLNDTKENVTVSKAIKFTLAGKDRLKGSIAAGSRYIMTTSETTSDNTEYTFTYVGGGSSSSISTPTTYAVNVNAATNGTVAADKKTASKGTTVTVTASPSKGYVVDAVKVVDKDGKDVAVTEKDGKYVFTMPASAVTVTGSFKAETPAPVALPFTDVKSGNWFYDAVKYAYEQGLMTGTSATTFAPNGTMNRAMIVTVLYRLEKSPAVTGASKFTDVPAGQWYSDAVAWAAANKIVNGYDETTFGPMNAVTREQMAAILFRYEQVKGLENVTLEENLNRFPDQDKISAYAIPALQWAVGQKIINGNADGTLDPTGTATRAQVAQIFTNLLNK